MQNKLHTKNKNTQKLSSTFSDIPVQGMFESRSSVVQHKQQENSQQPNLQKSLMQAERYGHHLQHTNPNKQTKTQESPIQQKTLVIGGPANRTNNIITLDNIADKNHASYDQYIGNAYRYAVNNTHTRQGGSIDTSHIQNPPLRIPDKFGGREHKWNPVAKRRGNTHGTEKHGPRISYQPVQSNLENPQVNEQQYLNNLGNNQTLDIMAHGTRSGKIGGYKPNELADLLQGMGLQGQQGTINLRACLSAKPGKNQELSPALQLEQELIKRGINMNVQGFKHSVITDQEEQYKDINIFKRGLNKVLRRKHPTVPARPIDTSAERARLNLPRVSAPVQPPIPVLPAPNMGGSFSQEFNQALSF